MIDDVTGVTKNAAIVELRSRIREHWDAFTPAARSVCRSLSEISPERLLYLSAQELGVESKTSNATVIRTLQLLGYAGLAELKDMVAAPFTQAHREERLRNRMEMTGGDPKHVWDRVIREAIERIEFLDEHLAMDSYKEAVRLMLEAREITTYGFGANYVAAEHLTLKLRRLGRRSRCIQTAGFRLADDLLAIERGDVVIVIAPGRLIIDAQTVIDRARAVGAGIILLSEQLVAEKLADDVTVAIHVPNTVTGITAEVLTTIVVTDALAQAVAAADTEQTLESAHTLETIRQQLGF
ncbi:RpiR family transcriptional regulator [Kribbella orskensis]|uniref:RpiR family transcriptional regulator n=1 Tax=Kribbella orskensis TaxID=2512216 RepID=A0ABY2BCG8_9ACTN|nr:MULTISPECIES: MurR/RpiR family transcriptional regulator [Kribbella]TCN35093.1 RpiR family transcriptional regulator [Kribbella sp. VKM Ac-2500]TCO16460.1 RpiR family transcriptional regulator [Kribbella orskensis]